VFKPARILVPTDMSDHSDMAIRHAFDIARACGAEVVILHVVTDSVRRVSGDYCMDEEQFRELESRVFDSARREVFGQLAKFASMGVSPVAVHIRTGSPHDQILKEAAERDADLIVIATFGRTGLARFLMGGVVRHVLAGAACSVLLVK
jgi:universal stress protein A